MSEDDISQETIVSNTELIDMFMKLACGQMNGTQAEKLLSILIGVAEGMAKTILQVSQGKEEYIRDMCAKFNALVLAKIATYQKELEKS